MSIAAATTLLTFLRGTDTDDYGDTEDTPTIIAKDIPGSIIEQPSKTVQTPDTTTPQVIRRYATRVTRQIDIRDGDRVRDQKTGIVYIIDSFVRNASFLGTPPTQIDLRRVT